MTMDISLLMDSMTSDQLQHFAEELFEELRMRMKYSNLEVLADNIIGYASDAELKCEYWNRTRDEQ